MDDIVSIIMELRRAERALAESEGGRREFRRRLAEEAGGRDEVERMTGFEIGVGILSALFV